MKIGSKNFSAWQMRIEGAERSIQMLKRVGDRKIIAKSRVGSGAQFHACQIPIFIYFGRPISSNLEAALNFLVPGGSGPPTKVRALAHEFASVLGTTPNARNINFDWNEPVRGVRVEVDQDPARALGISSQASSCLHGIEESQTNLYRFR